jgi:hypothetical protein
MCTRIAIAAIKNRDRAKLSRALSVAIEALTVQPTELPILNAVVSIIQDCDVSATPHQITFQIRKEVPLANRRADVG